MVGFSINCWAKDYVFGIGTGATSGSWYGLGGTLAEYISRDIEGVNCWPEITGSSVSNCDLVAGKELLFGFSSSHATFRIDEDTKYPIDMGFPEELRSVALIGYSHGSVVVPADSDIYTIQDLKGHSYTGGVPGMGAVTPAIHLLEAAGLDWREDVNMQFLNHDGMKNGIISGRLDSCFFQMSACPAMFAIELATARPIRLLDIPIDLIEKIQEKHGKYIVPLDVEPGAYPWMDKTLHSMANFSMFITNKEVDEELVYKIIKLIYEKQDEMAEIYSQISDWRFNKDAMFIDEVIPLHPGAIRFYKEIGLLQ